MGGFTGFAPRAPRVAVESFCTEVSAYGARPALAVDLSSEGIRIQRPVGGPVGRSLQLELEVPGADELIWAGGAICFDEIWRLPSQSGVLGAVMRTTGLRFLGLASRDRRLLRDVVMDRWRAATDSGDRDSWLMQASCYRA